MAVVTVAFEDLSTWLQEQPANTVDTPYELNITGLTAVDIGSTTSGTLGNIILRNTKFVDLRPTQLPDDIEGGYLGETFRSCSKLVYAPIIPSSVTSLHTTFRECTNLKEVTITGDYINLTDECFLNCSSLTTLKLGCSTVRGGLRNSFSGCSKLKTFYTDYPSELKTFIHQLYLNGHFIRSDASCTYIPYTTPIEIDYNDLPQALSEYSANTKDSPYQVRITNLPTNISHLELGQRLKRFVDLSYTEIPSNITSMQACFYECQYLVISPVIPNTVTDMSYCFSGDAFFSSLKIPPVIPNSVTNMTRCFKRCTSLEEPPVIPDSVTEMEECFISCTKITRAPTLPNGVINIIGCFKACISLVTPPEIPSGVTSLKQCFYNCTSLTTTPTIPDSVIDMEQSFYSCSSLVTPPTIPSSVTNMKWCFASCSLLSKTPLIPNSVVNLSGCFKDCTSLNEITNIPSSVTDMSDCFNGCTSLTKTPAISESVTNLQSCFEGCTTLNDITNIPTHVTNIKSCFSGCTALTVIPYFNIPNSVEDITNCFKDCNSLTEITIFDVEASFIETLVNNDKAQNVFSGCTSLTKIGVKTELSETDDWHIFSLNFGASTVEGKVYDKDGTSHNLPQTQIVKSDLKLPILTDELWFPTGYTDSQIEAIIQKMITYRYGVFNKETIPPDEKTFVLQADNPAHFRSNLPFVKESDVVDTVASGNLHSVTSNATANAIATEVTNRNTAIGNAINTEVTNRNTAIANAQNISVGYSYTDRFTGGYWVDGRAVYRKTLVYSNIAFNNQTQLPTYIATNATIISIHCIAYDTAGNFFNVPYYNVYGNYSLAYYLNANKVINLVASTNDSVYYFHFIIEYAL